MLQANLYLDHQDAKLRVEQAIEALRSGKSVIMVDDEDRENEGDLVCAAQFVTPELVNFMAKEGRGLICLTLAPDYVDRLNLPMMRDPHHVLGTPDQHTAFTVSIEARNGVTTGISAKDRAHTIQVAIADDVKPTDIVVPGHVFPLRAKRGGVLERSGHTEGSVDLARLAGLKPAAVICEIMNNDGTMARLSDLRRFAETHSLPIVSIADIIHFRLTTDSLVRPLKEETLKVRGSEIKAILFESSIDQSHHVALVKGGPFFNNVVEVRVHKQRPFMDAFPAGDPSLIDYGMKLIANSDAAVFLYLTSNQFDYLKEYDELCHHLSGTKEESSSDARAAGPMDHRFYGVGAQILRYLGVRKMKIHVSTPKTLKGLSGFELEIVGTSIIVPPPP